MRSVLVAIVFVVLATESFAGERRVRAVVTAYCPCRKCCGKYADGKTATGRSAYLPGCAVDPKRVRYGSTIRIPPVNGFPAFSVVADDTGSAMRRSKRIHIDLRFKTHAEALRFGRNNVWVRISTR